MRFFALCVMLVISFFLGGAKAETPDAWVALGARVHGSFGSMVALGILIGEDAMQRLGAGRRETEVTYSDGRQAPCACMADGVAIATTASVGQRTLSIAAEPAPEDIAAVVIIRSRRDGNGFKYTIPMSAMAILQPINKNYEGRERYDAVVRAQERLYTVEPVR